MAYKAMSLSRKSDGIIVGSGVGTGGVLTRIFGRLIKASCVVAEMRSRCARAASPK